MGSCCGKRKQPEPLVLAPVVVPAVVARPDVPPTPVEPISQLATTEHPQSPSLPLPQLSSKDLEALWTNRDEGIVAEMLRTKRRVTLFGIPLTELLTLEPDEVDILLSEERTSQDIADGLLFLNDTEQTQVLQAMTPDLAASIRSIWDKGSSQQSKSLEHASQLKVDPAFPKSSLLVPNATSKIPASTISSSTASSIPPASTNSVIPAPTATTTTALAPANGSPITPIVASSGASGTAASASTTRPQSGSMIRPPSTSGIRPPSGSTSGIRPPKAAAVR